MRIAVLLYGQPRFFNLTYKRIKEEYNLPNVHFDFFIHFWEKVGFCPDCDKTNDYIVNDNLLEHIKSFDPKLYQIDSYIELDNLGFLLQNTFKFLSTSQIQHKRFLSKDRYEFGQHLSLKKAYSLMEKYENNNNIQYDAVIKTRSDFIYKDSLFFKNHDRYIDNKKRNYTIPEDKINCNFAFVTSLCRQTYSIEKQEMILIHLNEYHPDKTILHRDKYNSIRIDDINICASRKAANFYYNRWFETYFRTYIFDHINNLEYPFLSYRKHDTLHGDIAIYNKIHLVRLPDKRYIRLYLEEKCKEKWKRKSIGINNIDSDEDITQGIKKLLK